MIKKPKTILLIVDDESTVCRALSRILRSRVDEVVLAFSPSDAEAILASKAITHLLCDHWFGPGQALGLDLARKWKKKYPTIGKAILLTGTDLNAQKSPGGIDAIVSKTIDPNELAELLALTG